MKQTSQGALVTCFAGCSRQAVLGAIGLTTSDVLAVRRSTPSRGRRIEAVYVYEDDLGQAIAEKVRYQPKAFRWRRSTRRQHGLGGIELCLYSRPALIDQKRVLVAEGEKAVHRLADIGLVATCPPAGASSWRASWSSQLWRAGASDVFILADHDRCGDEHAERVAAALNGYCEVPSLPPDAEAPWADWPMAVTGDPEVAPLRVKVIRLPGLPVGGDVVDYLDAGHGVADLLAIVEATPWWAPTLHAELRQQRRRSLTAARVRRYRAKQRSRGVTQRLYLDQSSRNT